MNTKKYEQLLEEAYKCWDISESDYKRQLENLETILYLNS